MVIELAVGRVGGTWYSVTFEPTPTELRAAEEGADDVFWLEVLHTHGLLDADDDDIAFVTVISIEGVDDNDDDTAYVEPL